MTEKPDIRIPDEAHVVRERYAAGATVKALIAETKFSNWRIYRYIDGLPQKDGTTLLPPLPRRRMVATRRMLDAERAAVVARLMRTSERQIQEIEKRIGPDNGKEHNDVRMLAILSRTMRELTALDALNRMAKEKKRPTAHDGNDRRPDSGTVVEKPIPADLDEFRKDLSRRLDQIVAEAAALPDSPDDAG